jgi:hypothetical protein
LPDRPGASANLRPKEHGAYAILLIPLGLAWVLAGPTWAGMWIAAAAISGFLAHEPLLVTLGRRGNRAQRSTPQARSRLVLFSSLAVFSGLAGLMVSSTTGQIALLGCLLLALSSFAIAVIGKHRTLFGQLWGVLGLSAPSVPILIAGDVSTADACRIWAVFLMGFLATTLAVRSVIAFQKRQPRFLHLAMLSILSIALLILAGTSHRWILAAIPMVGISWYLLLLPPPAKHLKRVGWSLVSGTLLTACLTAAAF